MKRLNKKKILFLKCEKTPGSKVYLYDLFKKFKKLEFDVEFKENIKKKYDFIFTMGNNPSAHKIKNENPDSSLIICDPKQSNIDYVKNVISSDLVLACSIEQKDIFLRLNSNIIIFPAFPEVKEKKKYHKKKEKIIIGYHGNRVHLNAMNKNIIFAIQELSKQYRIQINLIYNIDKLGKVHKLAHQFSNLSVKHIQWNSLSFNNELDKLDIGIAPSLLPINNNYKAKEKLMIKNIKVNYEPFDYVIRYKCSSNSGRISVFAKKYIPVIAEPTPSNCQIINDGVNGFLSYSYYSWLQNLELLISDYKLRNKISNNLIKTVKLIENYALKNLIENLSTLRKKVNPKCGYEEVIKELSSYKHNKNISKLKKLMIKVTNLSRMKNAN